MRNRIGDVEGEQRAVVEKVVGKVGTRGGLGVATEPSFVSSNEDVLESVVVNALSASATRILDSTTVAIVCAPMGSLTEGSAATQGTFADVACYAFRSHIPAVILGSRRG